MIKGRKIVTLLIAAAAAVLLWLYVVTSVAPEATARINSIPVTIDGSIILEERGLIITKRNTTAVSLEVSASRSDLSKLNASSIGMSADASKIRSPGDYELSYTVIFPDTVNTGDIDILRKSTNRVGVTVEKLEKKTLALSTHWENSVQDGYIAELASAVIEPAEVTLVGPENEISQITEARVSFDLASRNETVFETVPIAFLNKDGEEVSLSEYTNVTVTDATLTLQIFKESIIE
jgi:YbbR domain-containing protein